MEATPVAPRPRSPLSAALVVWDVAAPSHVARPRGSFLNVCFATKCKNFEVFCKVPGVCRRAPELV